MKDEVIEKAFKIFDLFSSRIKYYYKRDPLDDFATNTWVLDYEFKRYPAKIIRETVMLLEESKEGLVKDYQGGIEIVKFFIERGYACEHNGKIIRDKESLNHYIEKTNLGHSNKIYDKTLYNRIANEEQLVQELIKFSPKARKVIDEYKNFNWSKMHPFLGDTLLRDKSITDIVDFVFGPSIYRAFSHESPRTQYTRWYKSQRIPETIISRLESIKTQEEFDLLHLEITESLVSFWKPVTEDGHRTRMSFGVAAKIVNLLFKHLFYNDKINNDRIEQWLQIPLDSFTLRPMSSIIEMEIPDFPRNPTMSSVRTKKDYQLLQKMIARIANKANVPPLWFEFYAWDSMHQ